MSCRGPQELGLAITEPYDIRLATFDGFEGAKGELDDGYRLPAELPLHTEILRARSDVDSVVHAHPLDTVAANLAGLKIRPVVGAFDIPAAKLAAGGIPVYPRSVLISNQAVALDLALVLGDRPLVILRGHGVASVANGVAHAVLQAVAVNQIASLSLRVASAGATPTAIAETDLADLPDLGGALNVDAAWRHELARAGLDWQSWRAH